MGREGPEAELLPGLQMPLAVFGLSWSSLSLADVCLAFFLTTSPLPGRGKSSSARGCLSPLPPSPEPERFWVSPAARSECPRLQKKPIARLDSVDPQTNLRLSLSNSHFKIERPGRCPFFHPKLIHRVSKAWTRCLPLPGLPTSILEGGGPNPLTQPFYI